MPDDTATICARLDALEARLERILAGIRASVETMETRLEQRVGEVRTKQEEDLVLLKALSCQLRGRVERADRRLARGG